MNMYFGLMLAVLFTYVQCTAKCNCPALERYLLDQPQYNQFRNPWPFLGSAERLYLKYMPHLKDFTNINCVISDFIKYDSSSDSVERNVSWTILGETPKRDTLDVELEKSSKSVSEFTAKVGYRSWDFDTIYVDIKCLIVKISHTQTGHKRLCLLWVKEKYLQNPLRHCRFLYDVFCNWKRDNLKPTKDCDKGIKKKDKRPPRADIQNSGATRPPR
uniref:Putative lipocalin-7 1 n=1 Tax=Ixodes ricinus TaxID=34613 RepID=V5IBM7_IXORI